VAAEAQLRAVLLHAARGRKQTPALGQPGIAIPRRTHQESPAEQQGVMEHAFRPKLPHDETHSPHHQLDEFLAMNSRMQESALRQARAEIISSNRLVLAHLSNTPAKPSRQAPRSLAACSARSSCKRASAQLKQASRGVAFPGCSDGLKGRFSISSKRGRRSLRIRFARSAAVEDPDG